MIFINRRSCSKLKALSRKFGGALPALALGGGIIGSLSEKGLMPLLIGAMLGLLSCWAAVLVYTVGQLEENACLIKQLESQIQAGSQNGSC